MTNRILTLAAGLLPAVPSLGAAKAPDAPRPNFLVIMSDDLTYWDLSIYGSQNHRMPALEALAADGMLFTNAYNSCTTSVPTRHSLYTGMYPYSNGGFFNLGMIRPGVRTMPMYMQELGYRCGLAGKWHIWPESQFPWEDVPGFQRNCMSPVTDYTIDGVKEFMTRDSSQPFCLMLASINSHMPWTGGDPSVYDRDSLKLPPIFADTPLTRENYARYLAEIDQLDREIGDVIGVLKDNGLYDNTVIIYLSEQGSQLTGAKWTCWTPGVHAGMVAKWTGHIEPGRVSDAIVQYEDILPTLVDLAGGEPAECFDGRSLRRLFEGRTDRHRRYAYHFHVNIPSGPQFAMRAVSDGHYRLIWNLSYEKEYKAKNHDNAAWFKEWKASGDAHADFLVRRWHHRPQFELYDTVSDPFEFDNLAGQARYRRVEKRLLKALRKWMESEGDPGEATDIERPSGAQYEKMLKAK